MPLRTTRVASLVFGTCLIALNLLSASENTWTSIGPPGGQVRSLAIHPWDPSVVFAGTIDGLYRSDDGGSSWVRTGNGIGSTIVWSIQIDPINPDVMVANTWGRGGLVRSVDGGNTWQQVSFGENRDIRYLRSYTSQFVLVVIDEGMVFTSVDRGDSWIQMADGIERIHEFVIHPVYTNRVFALSESGRAVSSRDGGTTWNECSLPSGYATDHAVFDPRDPATIYLPSHGALATTRNECGTWTVRDHEWMRGGGFFEADPNRTGTLYASGDDGIWRSTNRGSSWHRYGPQTGDLWSWAMAVSAADEDVMYLAAKASDERRGVFRSLDGGANWTISTNGLNISQVRSLQVNPISPSIIYAATGPYPSRGEGVFKSTDSGLTWRLLDTMEEAGPLVALDPLMPNVLYASKPDSAVVKSIDSGESWTEVWSGFSDDTMDILTADPHQSGTLYAVVDWRGIPYRSIDGGESWIKLILPDETTVLGLYPHPGKPGTIFASTYGGLLVSNDRGDTWLPSSSGLEPVSPCNPWFCEDYHNVAHLAFDPVNPERIYAATEVGPFHSFDGGKTWRLARTGMLICCEIDGSWSDECDPLREWKTSGPLICEGGPRVMAVDPDRPEILYATTRFGTYRSCNRGFTWARIEPNSEERLLRGINAIGGNVLLTWSATSGVLQMEIDDPPRLRRPQGRVAPPPPRR